MVRQTGHLPQASDLTTLNFTSINLLALLPPFLRVGNNQQCQSPPIASLSGGSRPSTSSRENLRAFLHISRAHRPLRRLFFPSAVLLPLRSISPLFFHMQVAKDLETFVHEKFSEWRDSRDFGRAVLGMCVGSRVRGAVCGLSARDFWI